VGSSNYYHILDHMTSLINFYNRSHC